MFVNVYIVVLCCFGFLLLLRRLRMLKLTNQVPVYPGAWPIIGHLLDLLEGHDALHKIITKASLKANDHDGVITLWMGPKPFYVITDPRLAYKLSNLCLERNFMYKFAAGWVGDGLVSSSSTIWKRHRKLLSPTFNMHLLNGFLGIFNNESRYIVQEFEKEVGKGNFDHVPVLTDFGVTTIFQTAIGLHSDETKYFDKKRYTEAVNDFEGIILKRTGNLSLYIDWIYKLTSLARKEKMHTAFLRGLASDVMNRRKSAMKIKADIKNNNLENKEKKMIPFLDLMLNLQSQGLMTDKEINDEVNTIIAAGHETTSIVIVIILHLLGRHKDVQKKVFNEIENVLGADARDVNKIDLPQLIYPEAVIKETLRMFPSVPFILREATEDVELDTFTLPCGSSIIFSIWGMNKNQEFWGADAEVFDPERWMESSRTPDHPSAMAAFSLGKRVCLGKTYAIMMIKVFLVHVLRRFKIHSKEDQFKTEFKFVNKPCSGHHISVELR